MKLTEALKKWAVDNLSIKADASDEEFVTALKSATAGDDPKLSLDKFVELSAAKSTAASDQLKGLITDGMSTAIKPLAESIEKTNVTVAALATDVATLKAAPNDDDDDDAAKAAAAKAAAVDDDDADEESKKIDARVKAVLEKMQNDNGNVEPQGNSVSFSVFSNSAQPRVKLAVERYSDTKGGLCYPERRKNGQIDPRGGQPVSKGSGFGNIDEPSQRDLAVCGAWFKHKFSQLYRQNGGAIGKNMRVTEHDKELMAYSIREMKWTGPIGMGGSGPSHWVEGKKLDERMQKALIDDSTSGGEEAVPDVFDNLFITTPLLHGELFPLVELINLSQGSSVDGFTIANPTINSNYTEGVAINLESTSSFIGALDTTIFGCSGAIEIGLDFEDDSPANIGQTMSMLFGEALMEWLDDQIANGDGTTEPTGIFATSGTTIISTTNGTSGPWTIGDAEQMLFGVNKATRKAKGDRSVYVMNDTTYRRLRGVNVGSSDARRVFGMDHENYTVLDRPVKIQDTIADNDAAFVNMAYYRMYRRLGMKLQFEEAGQTLRLKNTKLVILRARFGGQITLGSAVAEVNDAPVVNS